MTMCSLLECTWRESHRLLARCWLHRCSMKLFKCGIFLAYTTYTGMLPPIFASITLLLNLLNSQNFVKNCAPWHCGLLLQECFPLSSSFDDIFSIIAESVVICDITQRLLMEDYGLSAVSHCEQVCLIFGNAPCSYILRQKENRSYLLYDDIVLQTTEF